MTGIDATPAMLEEAKEKKCYKELRKVFCCAGEFPEDFKEKFTIVTSVGFLLKGHVTPDVIDEKLSTLEKKEGSALIFAARNDYYEELGFKARVDQLVSEGKLELVYQKGFTKQTRTDHFEDKSFFYPVEATLYHFRYVF